MFKLRDRKGSMSVQGMGITLVTFAVIGIIGVYIFQNIYTGLPALTGDANTAVEGFATNYYSGVNLLGVAIIVLAAVAILTVVGWLQRVG